MQRRKTFRHTKHPRRQGCIPSRQSTPAREQGCACCRRARRGEDARESSARLHRRNHQTCLQECVPAAAHAKEEARDRLACAAGISARVVFPVAHEVEGAADSPRGTCRTSSRRHARARHAARTACRAGHGERRARGGYPGGCRGDRSSDPSSSSYALRQTQELEERGREEVAHDGGKSRAVSFPTERERRRRWDHHAAVGIRRDAKGDWCSDGSRRVCAGGGAAC